MNVQADPSILGSVDEAIKLLKPKEVINLKTCNCEECAKGILHDSDCSVHNEPAYPKGKCDCSKKDTK